jgi:Flp pilus assembly protein TadD
MRQEEVRQMAENERTAAEIASRERMNTADNDTAMRLAAAEIMSGEKIAVSTGTGINPGTR